MCVPGTIRVCTLHVHVHTHTGTTHTGGAWALRDSREFEFKNTLLILYHRPVCAC